MTAATGAGAVGQFVILAQSNTGRACEQLIRDALEHSSVFVFGELLACPNVLALEQSPDGARWLALLRIFAYGVYSDYKERRGELPELSPGQLRKLQLLTLVSHATKAKHLDFSALQEALDMASQRDLEHLIIDAVYQNLIVGKMDQERQCLNVESCFCRDAHEEDIDYIIETLTSWRESAQKMIGSLEGMVQHSHASYKKHMQNREELDKAIQATREALKEGDGAKSGDGGCTRMSIDDDDEASKRAKSTRGRWLGSIAGPSRGSKQ